MIDPNLLHLMQSPPLAAQQLTGISPEAAPAPPSLWDRLRGLVGKFGQDYDTTPYAGMLPDDALQAARAQARSAYADAKLSGGGVNAGNAGQIGANTFQQALQGAGQLQEMHTSRAKQAKLEAARQRIFAKYPPAPNETVQQTAQRLQRLIPELSAEGDTEMVGKLVELLKTQGDILGGATAKPQPYQEVDAGDRIELYDSITHKLMGIVKKGATPKAPGQSDVQTNIEFQRQYNRASTLQKNYDKKIEGRLAAAQTIAQSLASIPMAKAGDGAAQVELLYSFIKAMDPSSAVREGEIALAREATPLWEWARANVEKVRNKSAILPPGMTDRLETILRRRLSGYAKYIDGQRDYFKKRAQASRLGEAGDPDELFLDAETLIGVPLGNPATDSNTNVGPKLPDIRTLRKQ